MDEREKFVRWYDSQPEDFDLPRSAAWAAWQAALASRDVEPVAEVISAQSGSTANPDVRARMLTKLPEGTMLYTTPPLTKAAVSAAIEQCAKVLDKAALPYANGAGERNRDKFHTRSDLAEAIRALQTEDGLAALREFGERLVGAAADRQREICMNGLFGDGHLLREEVTLIVDRVLREMKGK